MGPIAHLVRVLVFHRALLELMEHQVRSGRLINVLVVTGELSVAELGLQVLKVIVRQDSFVSLVLIEPLLRRMMHIQE